MHQRQHVCFRGNCRIETRKKFAQIAYDLYRSLPLSFAPGLYATMNGIITTLQNPADGP